MTIPTVSLDENSPAGNSNINQGDDRIREFKTQNREILEIDHVYPTSGQDATAGKHKQVSLIEQADLGSGATGLPLFGAQTSSGAAESRSEALPTEGDGISRDFGFVWLDGDSELNFDRLDARD